MVRLRFSLLLLVAALVLCCSGAPAGQLRGEPRPTPLDVPKQFRISESGVREHLDAASPDEDVCTVCRRGVHLARVDSWIGFESKVATECGTSDRCKSAMTEAWYAVHDNLQHRLLDKKESNPDPERVCAALTYCSKSLYGGDR